MSHAAALISQQQQKGLLCAAICILIHKHCQPPPSALTQIWNSQRPPIVLELLKGTRNFNPSHTLNTLTHLHTFAEAADYDALELLNGAASHLIHTLTSSHTRNFHTNNRGR